MKGLKNRAISFALWIWQLPQNLLGLLLLAVYGCRSIDRIEWMGTAPRWIPSSMVFLNDRMRGGISLGRYVLINSTLFSVDIRVAKHERGHSIQSMILGPLYLFVVGIPSLLWAAWWNHDRGVSYYWFYTERWADRLGGVERC